MAQFPKIKIDEEGAGAHLAEQPIVFVLVGIPAAGKTTWAQKIFGWEVYDNQVVGTDYFVDLYAQQKGKTYDQVWKKAYKEAEKSMKVRLQSLIKKKHLVIWDQTNLTVEKRKKILEKFPKEYKKYCIVFRHNSIELVKSRLETRGKNTGKNIPIDVWNNMRRDFVIPTAEEGFDGIAIVG